MHMCQNTFYGFTFTFIIKIKHTVLVRTNKKSANYFLLKLIQHQKYITRVTVTAKDIAQTLEDMLTDPDPKEIKNKNISFI